MTRYPAWKRHDVNRKWRGVLAIFLTITLIFAATNGILRTISLKNFFDNSKWDGKAPFIAAIAGKSGGLFIFNREQKKILVFNLPQDVYLMTGRKNGALEKVSDTVRSRNGAELLRLASLNFGVPVENYIFIEDLQEVSGESIQKFLKDYASPINLIAILVKGTPKGTNIARYDAFKLWWQLKDFRLNGVEMVHLDGNTQGVVVDNNQKVLGVDEESLRVKVSLYTKNSSVVDENYNLEISNSSGSTLALGLAADFASSLGYKVDELSSDETEAHDCLVVANQKGSYSAKYLAEVFGCDNISQPTEGGLPTTAVKLVIGKEFANKYFE